jgi:ribose transport system permease protein
VGTFTRRRSPATRDESSTRTLADRVRGRASDAVSQVAAAGALIVVFAGLTVASDRFLTADNLFNIGQQTTVTAIIAIGMTLVIVTGGIDLSVGAVAALAGVGGTLLMARQGLAWPVATAAGCVIGALAGLVNGLLVTRARMAPFLATLGMMSVARGLVFIASGAVAVFGLPNDFRLLGQGQIGVVPIPVIVLAVTALAGHLVLTRTRLGRYSYAIGSNAEAARLSGIPTRTYLTTVYVICGALAGFGGMIAASRVYSGQPNFGIALELDVIAAAVIGGASLAGGQGTIPGTLIGAFLLALIRNGSVLLDINIFYQNVIIGVIIWAAVWWDLYRRRRLASET